MNKTQGSDKKKVRVIALAVLALFILGFGSIAFYRNRGNSELNAPPEDKVLVNTANIGFERSYRLEVRNLVKDESTQDRLEGELSTTSISTEGHRFRLFTLIDGAETQKMLVLVKYSKENDPELVYLPKMPDQARVQVLGNMRQTLQSIHLNIPSNYREAKVWNFEPKNTAGLKLEFALTGTDAGNDRIEKKLKLNLDKNSPIERDQDYKAQFTIDDRQQLVKADVSNHIRLKSPTGELLQEEGVSIVLSFIQERQVNDSKSLKDSIANLLAQEAYSVYPSEKETTNEYFQIAFGDTKSKDDFKSKVRELVASGDKAQLEAVGFELGVLLEGDDAFAKELAAIINRAGIGTDVSNFLIGLMSIHSTPAVQAALTEVISENLSNREESNQVMGTLATMANPTKETETFFRDLSGRVDDSSIQQAAELSLGSIAHQLGSKTQLEDVENAERVNKIAEELRNKLARAESDDERAHYLRALSNTGATDNLAEIKKQLKSENVDVRSAATQALQFMKDSESFDLLFSLLENDQESAVREQAARSLGFRAHTAETISRMAKLMEKEKTEQVHFSYVDSFYRQYDAQSKEVRLVLGQVANSKIFADSVKKVAESRLKNL